MPPLLSLQWAKGHCKSCLSQLSANFSTTSRAAALRNMPSPTSQVLGLDDEPSHNQAFSPSSHGGPRPQQGQQGQQQRVDTFDRMRSVLRRSEAQQARHEAKRQTMIEQLQQAKMTNDFVRQMPRRWKGGDVYAPHDLSPEEMAKWRRPTRPKHDVLDVLGLNPLDEYRNFSVMSEYMTPMGRIRHSDDTGLRPVNQRKMAKAIRRAIGLGLHPSVHKHPEILKIQVQNLPKQNMPSKAKGLPRSRSRF